MMSVLGIKTRDDAVVVVSDKDNIIFFVALDNTTTE
jgi:hypothetical protein